MLGVSGLEQGDNGVFGLWGPDEDDKVVQKQQGLKGTRGRDWYRSCSPATLMRTHELAKPFMSPDKYTQRCLQGKGHKCSLSHHHIPVKKELPRPVLGGGPGGP